MPASSSNTPTPSPSPCLQVGGTSSLAEDVSSKVRELDLVKGRVAAAVGRCVFCLRLEGEGATGHR